MWFLNKLEQYSLLKTEFSVLPIQATFSPKTKKKKGYAAEKKNQNSNSIWLRIFGSGDAAVTQQCIYVSKTVRHSSELGTLAHVASSV